MTMHIERKHYWPENMTNSVKNMHMVHIVVKFTSLLQFQKNYFGTYLAQGMALHFFGYAGK